MTSDLFAQSDSLDDTVTAALAARLEARKDNVTYMNMLADYLGDIELSGVESALALGAGTGVEVRYLLDRKDFRGHVIAQDLSSGLVDFGRKMTDKLGFGMRASWMCGDARNVELPAECCDLILAHTLLSHVDSPELVVKEAKRLLRPRGTFIIFDGDYATLTFGADDPEKGEKWDALIVRALIANPRIMRCLPRMLERNGLTISRWRSYAFHEIGKADFFLASLKAYPLLLPRAGVASPTEVDAFVNDQLAASERGVFYAGYNFMTYICKLSREG